MKKMNKKGFTIVELVIVIAVIAILAAVMIPTFSNIVTKANDSAALQEARTAYTVYMAEFDYTTKGTPATCLVICMDTDSTVEGADKFVAVIDGEMSNTVYKTLDDAKAAITKVYVPAEYTVTWATAAVELKDSDATVVGATITEKE